MPETLPIYLHWVKQPGLGWELRTIKTGVWLGRVLKAKQGRGWYAEHDAAVKGIECKGGFADREAAKLWVYKSLGVNLCPECGGYGGHKGSCSWAYTS